MFLKTSFTTLIVGVFVVYVLHTCWVMFGIVYTKPCDSSQNDGCITPFLAEDPKLQVSHVEGWMLALPSFESSMFSLQLSCLSGFGLIGQFVNQAGSVLCVIISVNPLCVSS